MASASAKIVKWLWAADSTGGHQDDWKEYDADVAEKIERAFQKGQKTMKLDAQRYIDFSDKTCILQRRYDDNSKRRGVKREEVDDVPKEVVKWLWADDSKSGHQDLWKEYDADVAKKIEEAYQKGEKEYKLDPHRFVDLSDHSSLLQRRYDDKTKRRGVKREVSKKRKGAPGADDDRATKRARLMGGPPPAPGSGIEIVFSFDTTGSMSSALAQVRSQVTSTVKRLMSDIPDLRIAIITHGDYCDGPKKLITMIDFSRSEREITNFVETAPTTSGGDYPEAYEYAMEEAQNLSWTPGTSKTLVMIGDAPPHTPAESHKQMKQFKFKNPRKISWEAELDNLVSMGVKCHGVRCCSSTVDFYEKIATRSGGKCVDLAQFDMVTDMLLAMCYREAGDTLFEAYRAEVAAAGRMDDKMTRMFDTL